jgi:predicted HD superfamily hydrolase involved in NAD metabolism
MTFITLARRVRAHIAQDHRYEHTVRVARCADVLAQRHGVDPGSARLAGMLHDLARLYPPGRLVSECESRGMEIDAFERAYPVVLHARLGAAIAAESFDVHEPAVLSAIEKHTTGSADMSPLDCTVFLADSLEPGRDFPERAEQWELAKRDIPAAMRSVLAQSVGYLSRKGQAVAPQTVAAARTFGVHLEEINVSVS